MSGRAICGILIAGFCYGGVAGAQTETLEEHWQKIALRNGLASPLTSQEQTCYRNLDSCYSQLTESDTPTLYYTTRVYFHIAERVVNGKADPLNFPGRQHGDSYDVKFVTAEDRAVIDKAIGMEWKAHFDSIARDNGLASPLTPQEQACYQNLGSCYGQLTASDTPALYYTTRVFFHLAERVVNGKMNPIDLPVLTKDNYDTTFIAAEDRAVIDKALDMGSKALLDSTDSHNSAGDTPATPPAPKANSDCSGSLFFCSSRQ